MPRSPELVIFVSMMTTTTMMTQPITLSLVYERGVKIGTAHIKCVEVEKCQNDDTHTEHQEYIPICYYCVYIVRWWHHSM